MKDKKATAGEKNVAKNLGWDIAQVRSSSAASESAGEIDRLIARERRKEREAIVAVLQHELDNAYPHEHTNTRFILAELIDTITKGGQR